MVSLELSKRLTDANGNAVGTGLVFTAALYEHDGSDTAGRYITDVRLSANGGAATIEGLIPGKIYTLHEVNGWEYGLAGFTITNLGTVAPTDGLLSFIVGEVNDGYKGLIQITLNNRVSETVPTIIPDDPIPESVGVPDELIEIIPDEVPLGAPETGAMEAISYGIWLGVAVVGLVMLAEARAKRRRSRAEQ